MEALRSNKNKLSFQTVPGSDIPRMNGDGYDYRNVQCIQRDYYELPVESGIVHDTLTPFLRF